MRRTAFKTWCRYLGSPISKANFEMATRSLDVCTDAARMLTWFSDKILVTSESNDLRSNASTWISTRKTLDWVGAHSTSTIRSGWSIRPETLVQSVRCTDTPEPRVTKPRIGSGGTGVQHRASFTQTSSTPRTTTPESE